MKGGVYRMLTHEGTLNKKVYLCNRVVRSSKSQHISVLALSLNRYHKIETLLFCSDTQSDTTFLIILCKDTNKFPYYGS